MTISKNVTKIVVGAAMVWVMVSGARAVAAQADDPVPLPDFQYYDRVVCGSWSSWNTRRIDCDQGVQVLINSTDGCVWLRTRSSYASSISPYLSNGVHVCREDLKGYRGEDRK